MWWHSNANPPTLTHTSSQTRPLTFVPLPCPPPSIAVHTKLTPRQSPEEVSKSLKSHDYLPRYLSPYIILHRRHHLWARGGIRWIRWIIYISRTMKTLPSMFEFSKVASLESFKRLIHLITSGPFILKFRSVRTYNLRFFGTL